MPRLLPRSLLAALLAAPVALAATTARAQVGGDPPVPPPAQAAPPPPPPDLPPTPDPPPAQVVPVLPPLQPAPSLQQPYPPPPYAPPATYVQPAPDRERVAPNNWYGWQTLIAVAPFDIAMFVGLARLSAPDGAGIFAAGFVARNLAPAVVHLAHGRPGAAFGSIGLHAASTATGLVIGYAIGIATAPPCSPRTPCTNGFRDLPEGFAYGSVAGSMVGTVLDVVFLAHRRKLTWTAAKTGPSWAMAPYATQRGFGLAAGGTL